MNTLRLRPKALRFSMDDPKISLEMIDLQTDTFGADVENIIRQIKDKALEKQLGESLPTSILSTLANQIASESKLTKAIEKLTFDRLGLKINLVTSERIHGAIMTFPVTDNHVLVDDFFKGHSHFEGQRKAAKIVDGDTGTIDLNNAKLGGMFSKYNHPVYVDFGLTLFDDKLEPAELTAILLHEFGHGFTYYEYSDRISATNQVMSEVARELAKPKEKRNYTYIYRELQNQTDLTEKEIDDLLSTENKTILSGKLAIVIAKCFYKESRTGKYEETSSEQLADQFATRFGYGRALITGLDKIMGKYSPDRNRGLWWVMHFIEIVMMFMNVFWLASLGATLAVMLAILFLGSSSFFGGDAYRNMTYDDLIYRYTRIRTDMITQLKLNVFSPEETKTMIESIKTIDEIIKKVRPYVSLYQLVGNVIFSKNRDVKQDIAYQKLVERLSSNDLFLKAAELKQV